MTDKFRTEHLSDDVTLYLGDCREVLPTLGAVDAVVTDPPYSEKTHAGARTGGGAEILIDFASIADTEFVGLCDQCVAIASRWVIMTCDWRHAAEAERRLPEKFIRAGIWIKPNGMPQYTGDRPATGWEAIAILHRPGIKRWNGGGRHAVWIEPKINGEHRTQKPLPLITSWIKLFSDHAEIILDPFMGSGTTGVACVKLGRKFVGIEIEPKYFEIACRRIADELKRPRLPLDEPRRKATQETLAL